MPLPCIPQYDIVMCCKCQVSVAGYAIPDTLVQAQLVCQWCMAEEHKTIEFMGLMTDDEIAQDRAPIINDALTLRLDKYQNVHDNTIETHIDNCYRIFDCSREPKTMAKSVEIDLSDIDLFE